MSQAVFGGVGLDQFSQYYIHSENIHKPVEVNNLYDSKDADLYKCVLFYIAKYK